MKKVSVVIPCRNESPFIERCIRSIVESAYPEELMEIIVCDGMSDDGTATILKTLQSEIPILKIIRNEKRITPVAMNLGIQDASGDYILILGAHSTLDTNYILENVTTLNQNSGVWCSGGMLKNVFLDNRSKNISAAMSSPFGVGSAHFRTGTKSGEVDTVAFGLYRREVFNNIGSFDEKLIRNQDDELNYRIIKAGGKIRLTLNTSVNYYVRSSWKKLFQQYFQYGYWKIYVNRKHRAITTARQVVPLLFVLFLFTSIISFFIGQHLSTLCGILFLAYVVLAIASAMRYSSRPKDILEIIISFFILHLSYGLGYAKGILDFFFLRKTYLILF